MLGRIDEAGELVFAKAPDMDLEWTREPGEAAEAFDHRICQAILAARGLPPLQARPSLVRLRAEPCHRAGLKGARV
jgi:hypothetical protein